MNPAVTDYYLNVPATLNINNVKAAFDEQYPNLDVEWPQFPMPGTHAVSGRAVLHIRMKRLVTKAQLETLFTNKGVNWTVIGIRSAYPINNGNYVTTYFAGKAQILPAIDDVPSGTYDVDGNPIMRPATMADVVNLSGYMGTNLITL